SESLGIRSTKLVSMRLKAVVCELAILPETFSSANDCARSPVTAVVRAPKIPMLLTPDCATTVRRPASAGCGPTAARRRKLRAKQVRATDQRFGRNARGNDKALPGNSRRATANFAGR